jgi:hypothetical protein
MMTEEHSEFLADLRNSGAVNMFGATPYLMEAFGLSNKEARTILVQWMESFREQAV